MLFVAKLTGSYALEIRVLRADNLSEATEMVSKTLNEGDVFTGFQLTALEADGEAKELFSASYIE